jgi:hypothetical protein
VGANVGCSAAASEQHHDRSAVTELPNQQKFSET